MSTTAETQPAEAASESAPAEADQQAEAPRKTKGRKASSARKTRTVELTLTVTGTADGEWQAELTQAGRRVLHGLPVPAASVSRAAAELHADIATAIDTVLEAAREQHRARLAELEAELSKVRQALSELQDE